MCVTQRVRVARVRLRQLTLARIQISLDLPGLWLDNVKRQIIATNVS